MQGVYLFRLGVDAKTSASILTDEGKAEIPGPALALLIEKELQAKRKLMVEMRVPGAFV